MSGTHAGAAPDPNEVVCRPATGVERRAALMLHADLGQKRAYSDFTVIASRDGTEVYGAAAHAPVLEDDGRRTLQAAIRIARPFRSRGLGTKLLAAVESTARAAGIERISIHCDGEKEPRSAAALEARGFAIASRMNHFEIDHAVMAAYLREFRDWLVGRGMVPAGARMVPLREAPLAWVTRLQVEQLGGTYASVAEGLAARLARPGADDSAALVVDGAFAGFCLCETSGETTVLDSNVLDPAFRGDLTTSGWANVFMLGDRTDWCLGRGSRVLRFSCRDTTGPTMKIARRTGARTVRVDAFWRRELESPRPGTAGAGSRP